MLRPSRREATGYWRILHTEELRSLYKNTKWIRWSNEGGWNGRDM